MALHLSDGDGSDRVAYKLGEDGPASGLNTELVREFLRKNAARLPQDRGLLHHLQIDKEQAENAPFAEFSHLNVFSHPNLRAFVALAKAPTVRDELLLISYAQHLVHLHEVQRLEHLVQLRNQFLSIASHELKTPLTSIYGMLQLQERMTRPRKGRPAQDPHGEKMHSFMKLVIRQVERLNEMIDGLLDVSRIQAGRFSIDPADTDVQPLLQELISTRVGPIADDAGVRIIVDASPGTRAWIDPIRFEEVVTNLVMNAIRFSPEGGAVWVRLSADTGALKLSVRDQGPAVPREDRERIFQPFERAQRTSRLGGLGLGLFVSRQIAQLHGGDVSLIESVPGRGNLFEATFPIRGGLGSSPAKAHPDREHHESPEHPESGPGRRFEMNSGKF